MNTTKVCSKNDVILEKDCISNDFIISLVIRNENVSLINITDYSFFKIMAEINNDMLDELIIEQDKINNNEANMYFLFKPIAKEFGILIKCISVKTTKYIENDNVCFESVNLDYLPDKFKNYDKITCNTSRLNIKIINNNLLDINYRFNIDIHEDLPIYIQNLIGLIMKKVILKTKLFIENIK
jgi:hypothetical protein